MCSSFTILQNKVGETFTSDEFLTWVGTQYNLRKFKDIETRDNMQSPSGTYFLWKANGYKYSARLQEKTFTQITIAKESGEVQAGDIIACFGSPEYYRAVHALEVNAGDAQYFDLFFPSAGVIAHGYRNYLSNDHTTRPIQDDFPILNFSILQPGTVEEMLEQIYGSATPFEYGTIREWPNNWEDIVIDITPEIQQLQNAP
jgi:hypothetical protein